MYLNKFNGKSPIRWFLSWIVGTLLCMVAGPLTAQEGWRSFYSPDVSALSAVLINPATGEVLFAKEPNLPLPPASTTKVLTAMVALDRLNPNSRLMVSPQAASAPPSRIGLRAGEAASTQDLLYGLLLKSGNDAAETLAEAAGGSVYGFADLMNAKAMQIGARNSHFTNPHGLPNDNHYSTAYDLALIFRHAMNYPMFADIVRTQSADLRIESGQGLYGDSRVVPVVSHNRLLMSYEGTRGGKTGFTIKARRCFVGAVDRGGVRLIVAILNSPTSRTLWQDARTLLDYGFARYGLAPSPMQTDGAPQPFMVRRTPIPEQRVTMVEPALQQWQPGIISRSPSVPPTGSRVTMLRPNAGTGDDLDFTPVRRTPIGVQASTRPAAPPPMAKNQDDDEDDLDFTPVRSAPVVTQTSPRPTVTPSTAKNDDDLDFTPVRSAPVMAQTSPRPTVTPSTAKNDDDLDFTPVRSAPVMAQTSPRPTVTPSTARNSDEDDLDFTPVRPTAAPVPIASRTPVAKPTAKYQDDDELDLTPVRPTAAPVPIASRTPVAKPTAKYQDDDELDLTPVRPAAAPVPMASRTPVAQPTAKYQDDDELDFTPVRPTAAPVPMASRTPVAQPTAKYQDNNEFSATSARPTAGTAPIVSRTTTGSPMAERQSYPNLTPVRQQPNAAPIASRTVSDQPSITPAESATPSPQATIAWTTPHEMVTDQPAVRIVPESTPNRRTVKARTEARSPTAQRLAGRSDAKLALNRQPQPRTAMDTPPSGKPELRPQPRVSTATARTMETENARESGANANANAKAKTAIVATAKPAVPSRNAVVVAMATPSTKPNKAAKPIPDMGAKVITPKQTSANPGGNGEKRTTKTARAELATPKPPQKNTKR